MAIGAKSLATITMKPPLAGTTSLPRGFTETSTARAKKPLSSESRCRYRQTRGSITPKLI